MTRPTVENTLAQASSLLSHRLEPGATRMHSPVSAGDQVCDGVEASSTRHPRCAVEPRRRAVRVRRSVLLTSLLLCAPALLAAQDPPKTKAQDDSDKRLAERLLRKTATGSDEGVMEAIIRLMNDAARRLEIDFDAGPQTRAVQERITDRLDEAIKIAASQRRLKRSRRSSGKSDKRRGDQQAASAAKKKATASKASGPDASSSAAPGRVTGTSGTGQLRETRRTWGHLPMRERDEILQGVQERFLETYREWIERYYRVLQEMDE